MAEKKGKFWKRVQQQMGRVQRWLHAKLGQKGAKLVVGILGVSVIIVGLAMVVLPGPAFLVIPAGLGILATEFVWARRWMKKAKEMVPKVKRKKKELVKKVTG